LDKELLIKLREEGISTRKIAAQLNVSQANVTYWLKKYKISTARKKCAIKTYVCISCRKENSVKNSRNKNKYCSLQCQQDYVRSIKNIDDYKTDRTRRQYLIRERGHGCENCKYSEWNNQPIPLELEHSDGNHENNFIENLKLLCPNCHAQTPTYKNKNKGNGRESRHLRYKQIYNA
jgi:predicted transcriptional regulator